jgi:uncharacterized protein YwbE
MVARPSVIFGDDTKNFLDDDLLTGALRSIREVGVAPEIVSRSPTHPIIYGSGIDNIRLHLPAVGRSTSMKVEVGGKPQRLPVLTRRPSHAHDQRKFV